MTFPFYAGRQIRSPLPFKAPPSEIRREIRLSCFFVGGTDGGRVSSARGREEGEERHDDDDRSDGGEFQQRQKEDRQSTFTVGGEMAGTWPLQPAATGATGKECRSTFTASPSWHL